jgi:hypothetical protein
MKSDKRPPSFREISTAVSIIGCHAYFEFVSQGLEECIVAVDNWISKIRARSQFEEVPQLIECVLEIRAKINYLHNQFGGAFKPAVMRECLEMAMEEYPNNVQFMSLYAENEARMKIENRVRRYLDTTLLR